jgi:hypothetical protein
MYQIVVLVIKKIIFIRKKTIWDIWLEIKNYLFYSY